MTDFFVFDTNSLISAALLRNSTAKKALIKAFDNGMLAISNETLDELVNVIFRRKFDSYFINDDERLRIIDEIETHCRIFAPNISINACRDPKDNKFLELAVFAGASCIITGDNDLLVLHPFRKIPILNASDFLKTF